jgi:uncharacterized protein involved in high-affinity Fe2+ transport
MPHGCVDIEDDVHVIFFNRVRRNAVDMFFLLSRVQLRPIEKYDMHIILDIHSLPGGINGLDIGEAVGHWGWYVEKSLLSTGSLIGESV